MDDAIQRSLSLCDALENEYPLAICTLDGGSAGGWQLLFATRLAAQCTDKRVNIVTKELYAKFPSINDLAAANPGDIEPIIRPCGLSNTKARDISAASRKLRDDFHGVLPDTMDALLSLPGVGRKTANLILGDVFGKPAVVTDTHCIRLANRFGLVDSKVPLKVERRLRELLPPERSNDFCHRLVLHGRAICTARHAFCDKCTLFSLCDRRNV